MRVSKGRILAVDDNLLNLKLVSRVLSIAGYEVIALTSAEDAANYLACNGVSLAILDIGMSGEDGLSFTRRLKQQPATRDIPVVILTSFASGADGQLAKASGCDLYLTKPIDTRTFAAQISHLVRTPVAPPQVGEASYPGADHTTDPNRSPVK